MTRALVLVAIATRIASAQASEPPEPDRADDVPAPEFDFLPPSDEGPPPIDLVRQGYSRSLAERPLLTPATMLEGAAALRIDVPQSSPGTPAQRGTLEVAARYGLSPGDIELGALLHAFATGDDVPAFKRLQGMYALGRVRLRAETALLAQMYLQTSQDAALTYRPGVFVQHKKFFTRATAIELTGGATYSHTSYESGFDPYRSVELLARVRLQLQLARLFALEPRAEYRHYELLDSSTADSLRSTTYGIYGLFSAAPALDVIGGVDLVETGSDTAWALTLGMVGRVGL